MGSGSAAWPQKITPVLDKSNCLLKRQNKRSDRNFRVCKQSALTFAPYRPTEVNELFISSKLESALEKLATTDLLASRKKISIKRS